MRAWLVLLLLGITGCRSGFFLFWRDTRTAEERARETLPHCAGGPAELEARAVSPQLIEQVEPAYARVPSGNDNSIRLRGARLHVRPDLNVSPELLQRALECHQTRVTLGSAPAIDDDPYVLGGTWLDIRVDSVGDGLVASVLTDRTADAHRILDRARLYAADGR